MIPAMSELGVLLLTDVVDSTQLSERLGDAAMAAVWSAHDRAARDLLPAWRGREIDKTDGMLLLFETAAGAVQYALAYHRALAALPVPLKARAGLHVGPVILRENSAADVARGAKPLEVDGLAKPTTARVMSLARGGQTLLTPEAQTSLGATPLPTQSHGHWVLKGLSAPIELFEVGEDAAAFAPPPDGEKVYRVVQVGGRWLPVRQIPNNLPEQLTSFIGRERELGELKALLGKARLLTLVGMGGMGKTRLSLQVAAELMAEFPDGAWFLDLSPIRDAALVASEAAQVLAVGPGEHATLMRSMRSPSMQPPDTEPATWPSSRITLSEPGGRGDEPQVRTTVNSTTRRPARCHWMAVRSISVSTPCTGPARSGQRQRKYREYRNQHQHQQHHGHVRQ